MKLDLSLYFITDNKLLGKRSLINILIRVMRGGASVIQLRDKEVSDDELITEGKKIIGITQGKIPLIINDRASVALKIGAAGVHIGQKDGSVKKTRELIGKNMILGVSAGTVEQAVQAQNDGADYIGAGPVFATSTKLDADEPIGLSVLAKIKSSVSIPVVAIGGINKKNAESVISIADGIAVISAILNTDDPQKETHELLNIINRVKTKGVKS